MLNVKAAFNLLKNKRWFIPALLCTLVLVSYTIKAWRVSKPQQYSYSRWLHTFDNEEENIKYLAKTSFSIQFPETLGGLAWEVSGSDYDHESNTKLKRLLDLAKASNLFSESSKFDPSKIVVQLNGVNKNFTASLTQKQIEQIPELQTFFKLFELYASTTKSVKEKNENS